MRLFCFNTLDLGCPVAYISFISDNRRWLKARYGLPAEVTDAPRESAVCTTTICGTELPSFRFETGSALREQPDGRAGAALPLLLWHARSLPMTAMRSERFA